jgi:hypothetical protein
MDRRKLVVALNFGWRSASALRLLLCFEFGFSRWGKVAALESTL